MVVHIEDPWEGSSCFVSVLHRKLRVADSFNREKNEHHYFTLLNERRNFYKKKRGTKKSHENTRKTVWELHA